MYTPTWSENRFSDYLHPIFPHECGSNLSIRRFLVCYRKTCKFTPVYKTTNGVVAKSNIFLIYQCVRNLSFRIDLFHNFLLQNDFENITSELTALKISHFFYLNIQMCCSFSKFVLHFFYVFNVCFAMSNYKAYTYPFFVLNCANGASDYQISKLFSRENPCSL